MAQTDNIDQSDLLSFQAPLDSFHKDLSLFLENNDSVQVATTIDISLSENYENGGQWVVFTHGPYNELNGVSYSYPAHAESLVEKGWEHCERLESLYLQFLGLKTIPKGLAGAKNIKNLTLNFNPIDVEASLEVLKDMKGLKVLRLYGVNISKAQLKELHEANPDLEVRYTYEQLKEECEENETIWKD